MVHGHLRLLAVLGVSAVLVAVAIAVSSSGGAKPVHKPLAPAVSTTFAGIPEHNGVLGDPRARFTLTEYVDLQCPICAETSQQTLPWLVENYVRSGKAKLEMRTLHFIGPDSERAALVAAGAERQGKLWPFVAAFYASQGAENSGYVTDAYLRSVAKASGVDAGRALRDAGGAPALRRLAQANADAKRMRVQATPTFTVAKAGGPARVIASGEPSPETLTAALR
jgi:protein-disulfide isomerase